MNKKMIKALNEQIAEELASAYLYLAMANWFEDNNLPGLAHWMIKQVEEEQEHAFKLREFIIDRGDKVTLATIERPTESWESALAAFEASLSHEKHITACIDKLSDLAIEIKDHATNVFLMKFVSEQVEEEKTVADIVAQLKLANNNPGTLLMLDRALASRS